MRVQLARFGTAYLATPLRDLAGGACVARRARARPSPAAPRGSPRRPRPASCGCRAGRSSGAGVSHARLRTSEVGGGRPTAARCSRGVASFDRAQLAREATRLARTSRSQRQLVRRGVLVCRHAVAFLERIEVRARNALPFATGKLVGTGELAAFDEPVDERAGAQLSGGLLRTEVTHDAPLAGA